MAKSTTTQPETSDDEFFALQPRSDDDAKTDFVWEYGCTGDETFLQCANRQHKTDWTKTENDFLTKHGNSLIAPSPTAEDEAKLQTYLQGVDVDTNRLEQDFRVAQAQEQTKEHARKNYVQQRNLLETLERETYEAALTRLKDERRAKRYPQLAAIHKNAEEAERLRKSSLQRNASSTLPSLADQRMVQLLLRCMQANRLRLGRSNSKRNSRRNIHPSPQSLRYSSRRRDSRGALRRHHRHQIHQLESLRPHSRSRSR